MKGETHEDSRKNNGLYSQTHLGSDVSPRHFIMLASFSFSDMGVRKLKQIKLLGTVLSK